MRRLLLAVLGALAAAAVLWISSARRPIPTVSDDGVDEVRLAMPTPVAGRAGRVWVARVEGERVVVAMSADRGRSFGPAVAVTPVDEPIDANGEGRPKIAVGPDEEIFVTWTRSGRARFTGDIRFSRSVDGGKTFSAPVTINDDGRETGHRFDALHVGPSGVVSIFWIDKRDLDAATAGGRAYRGAALYMAQSTDRGATFAPNRRVKDHVCECCRIAIATDGNVPVLVWRDVLEGGIRDHAWLRFSDPQTPGPAQRATDDGWAIDACPHHGPSLAVDGDGVYHLVYYTGEGPNGEGTFYQRSDDKGRTFTAPMRVSGEHGFGHGVVFAVDRRVVVAVREPRPGGGSAIEVHRSRDGGGEWDGLPEVVLQTAGSADHPQLFSNGGTIYLSWYTANEGLRIVPVV